MELKIMATILDETGIDSGGILMGVASLGMKRHTRIRCENWPLADAWVLGIT